jgi:hypothetical protein
MSNPQQENKLVRFVRLDGADKWLLLRAAGWLAIARMRLMTTPFSHLVRNLSGESAAPAAEPGSELPRRVGFAVAVAANHVPWRSDCFPQAIAARNLLKRHGLGSTIHLGVERGGDDALTSHAWLTCGDTVVVGGAELERYTEIHHLSA